MTFDFDFDPDPDPDPDPELDKKFEKDPSMLLLNSRKLAWVHSFV